jgi:hypothetical protein
MKQKGISLLEKEYTKLIESRNFNIPNPMELETLKKK